MSNFNTVSTVVVNLDRYMSRELGLDESLSDEERQLFTEFHKMRENEDYIFLWACAQMTVDDMALSHPGIILTQYGVTRHDLLFGRMLIEETEELGIKQETLATNREFIRLWKDKVEEMKAQRSKINSLQQETRALLDKNIYAVEAIRRIVQMLIDDGYTPINPDVVNTPVSEAFSKGVHIQAENSLKEKREVWLFLPGGKTKVHADTKNPVDCSQAAKDLASKVADALKELGRASIPLSAALGSTIPDNQAAGPKGTGRAEAEYGRSNAADQSKSKI